MRHWMKCTAGLLAFIALAAYGEGPVAPCGDSAVASWAQGIEHQRKADLGNGCYLNPIMSGDHPDPTILKDGHDYYMTFSSFDAIPGLVIWHSQDLINWQPVGPAVTTPVDSIWAPELVKHNDKYYLYFITNKTDPVSGAKTKKFYVITTDNIRGAWTPPREIVVKSDKGDNGATSDPGHAVGEDGKRYIFMSGGVRVQLKDDGLAVADGEAGIAKTVYAGWQYPEEWDVESFSQEGPKMLKHGDYFYMVLAEGGTAGPPTGHMVIAARSRSINGPWENSPYNPIIRTQSASEKWWSRGHATLVEGMDGQWYMVYHGYENSFMTLGRQALLEPITWTADGWFISAGYDVGKPIPRPAGGHAVPHGMAFSDSFRPEVFDSVWSFYMPGENEKARIRFDDGSLLLRAKGRSPKDTTPLFINAGDLAYQVDVEIAFEPKAQAGLLLFYSNRLYAGLAFNANGTVMHRYGLERNGAKIADITGNTVHLRLVNRRNILTLYTSPDGEKWTKYGVQMEVSGYNQNVGYDFQALRPAIYASGEGNVRFSHFRYTALP
ncbi:family 43 glycosylhydrolase [Dickeya chrysanthemi]|uniref:family 43 glycosylhydrolase n=1 Tax=Dickeya chrysanthemi TaxID=556 RepID=UPI001E39C7B0|nr:family 43 glycosylhydrolase [Dickeya chrysanthemi]